MFCVNGTSSDLHDHAVWICANSLKFYDLITMKPKGVQGVSCIYCTRYMFST